VRWTLGVLAAAFDFVEMVAQAAQGLFAVALRDFALEFGQREVNDVVVVDLLARQMIREIQPHLMQQVDFFRREARSVRAEVENLFVADGRENLEGDARARLGHALPGETDFASLLGELPATMVLDCRLHEVRSMPSHRSFAAATARRTGLPSFSAIARTLVKSNCSMVVKSWSGARSYSPDAARRSMRTCKTTISASRFLARCSAASSG